MFGNFFGKKDKKTAKKSSAKAKRKSPQEVLPLPDDIQSLLNNAGRIDIELLVALAKVHKQLDMELFLGVPVIAGKSVKPGIVREKTKASKSTQMFNPNEVGSDVMEEISQNAIFPLLKGSFAQNPEGKIFTVGRNSKNDLIIPDYAISGTHAQIRLEDGKYWIKDCGSTNKTRVNAETLEEDQEVALTDNDRVDFGRYEFRFYKPKTFISQLRHIEL